MKPKKIEVKENRLEVHFKDADTISIGLKYLRDECPCANCKGETILLRTYRPPKMQMASPEMYKVKSIKLVGDYALSIGWKDGHATGIYAWDYLQQLENDEESGKEQKYDPLL